MTKPKTLSNDDIHRLLDKIEQRITKPFPKFSIRDVDFAVVGIKKIRKSLPPPTFPTITDEIEP